MDVSEEHKVFDDKVTLFRASDETLMRRATSVGPGLSSYYNDVDYDEEHHDLDNLRSVSRGRVREQLPTPTPSRQPSRQRSQRHMSLDLGGVQWQSPPAIVQTHAPDPAWMSPPPTEPPTPPTPSSESLFNPHSPHLHSHARERPAQTLEDFRNALRADLTLSRRSKYLQFLICQKMFF